MDHEEIRQRTLEYGGTWAICHAQRILNTIADISRGMSYASEPLWLAAHLHDWGAYPAFAQEGVDHAVRSRQVAETFLTDHACPADLARAVLECIEFHHGGPAGRSIESILFTDADALDLLGAVGVLRVFSMKPRDLRGAVALVKHYRDMSDRAITLPSSRAIANERLQEMDALIASFEKQTGGVY